MDDAESLSLSVVLSEAMAKLDNAEDLSLSEVLPDALDDGENLSLSGTLPEALDDAENLSLSAALTAAMNDAENLSLLVTLPSAMDNSEKFPLSDALPDNMAAEQLSLSESLQAAMENEGHLSLAEALPAAMDDAENISLAMTIPEPMDNVENITLSLTLPEALVDAGNLSLSLPLPETIENAESLSSSVSLPEAMENTENMSLSVVLPDSIDDAENLCLSVALTEAVNNEEHLLLSEALPDSIDHSENLPLTLTLPEVLDNAEDLSLSEIVPHAMYNPENFTFSAAHSVGTDDADKISLSDDDSDDIQSVDDLSTSDFLPETLDDTEHVSSSVVPKYMDVAVNLSLSKASPDSTEQAVNLSLPIGPEAIDNVENISISSSSCSSPRTNNDAESSSVTASDDVENVSLPITSPKALETPEDLSLTVSLPTVLDDAENLSLTIVIPEDLDETEDLVKNIEQCLLPKLARNYDEIESHAEYDTRNEVLSEHIKAVLEDLEKVDLKSLPHPKSGQALERIAVLSSLVILYKELLCDCSWNSVKGKECAKKLNESFKIKFNMKLEDVLKKNELCNSQAVFDKILDILCRKLRSEDFKKFPGQIEVYCDLIQNFKNFDVIVNPIKVLPVSLILIDDYIETNKTKGLRCCLDLLDNLTAKDFENGNYYDVIYLSVKKALHCKDIKITELSQACCLMLCQVFPSHVKDEKLDEMFTDALEQLNTESNLYRKAAFFKYTKSIIQMLQIKCVGKSLFKTVVSEAIENCLTDAVADILLLPSLECLEEWIKYCWPVWKLPVDFKVLCALLKYYSKCNTGEGGLLTQKLIITLVSLCTPEEQKLFMATLEGKDVTENSNMEKLKKDVGTQS